MKDRDVNPSYLEHPQHIKKINLELRENGFGSITVINF